jgi:hypothetical protein
MRINGGHGDLICVVFFVKGKFQFSNFIERRDFDAFIMPRTKPTLKLGVYGSFDINPERAVTSYFESKLQDELY